MSGRADRRIRAQQMLDQKLDSAEELRHRMRQRIILEQVRAEVAEQYPALTPENVMEAIVFQERRIAELTKGESQ